MVHIPERSYVEQLIGTTFTEVGLNNPALSKASRVLLHSRKVPEQAWSELDIEIWMRILSSMDCNNKADGSSVGEREGRIYSPMVHRRHYGFSHGVGRSGDLAALQPKAPGSALLSTLTTLMVKDLLQRGCGIQAMTETPLITPVATGLSMSLCLSSLKVVRPNATRILFSRIDQKSAFKAILDQGYLVDSVPQVPCSSGSGFRTDVDAIRKLIKAHGPESYLAIVTCTSCFGPRAPDDVCTIAQDCKTLGVPHLVNNAYGLGCTKTTQMLQDACRLGRMDYVVQSLDKNFMVPVSGAVVFSNVEHRIKELAKYYPGRASSSHVIDLHITLLSMGLNGWKELTRQRKSLHKEVMETVIPKLCDATGLRPVITKSNQLSIALELPAKFTGNGTELGSRIYYRGISGLRCVSVSGHRDSEASPLKDAWGSHGLWDTGEKKDLLIFAVAIGSTIGDFQSLATSLEKCMKEMGDDGCTTDSAA